jgi:Macrocin-O-methyltransferase (TylF)
MAADEKAFDGRANFPADDHIEQLLDAHFERFGVSKREIWRNFQIYSRRLFLKRFLAHYELFRLTVDLPGDIVELGVYRGSTLFSWANFLEIRNMGDRAKKVIGFDNFRGLGQVSPEDGKEDPRVGKVPGGYNAGAFKAQLEDAIAIYDQDRFIGYKPRVVLVEGDIEESVERYIRENPGLRISLLHFDVDLYAPTRRGLELLWPRVVVGGVVLFDEYGIPPWEGESNAVDQFFANQNVRLRRLDWSTNPGAYLIKGG